MFLIEMGKVDNYEDKNKNYFLTNNIFLYVFFKNFKIKNVEGANSSTLIRKCYTMII